MTGMEMNRRVTLQKRTQPYGREEPVVEEAKTVWGAVEDVSMTFRINSRMLDLSPSLFVHLWRREFEKADYGYCVVDGVEYRIISTGSSYSPQYVKLMLERG